MRGREERGSVNNNMNLWDFIKKESRQNRSEKCRI